METNLKDFFSGDSIEFFIINNDYDGTFNCKVIFVKDNLKYDFNGNYCDNKFNFLINTEDSEKIKDNKYKVLLKKDKEEIWDCMKNKIEHQKEDNNVGD